MSVLKKKPRNSEVIRIAIAGQPNAGKTSLFNALTGSSRNVGNYPGVTVERRSGKYHFEDKQYDVVDLPGSYSLSSFSPEERVAQKELLDNTADVVVVVVDSTALTRSLVLLAQVIHLGANTVLALNMSDEAHAAGQFLDLDLMEELLGCPVVETEAHKRVGAQKLKSVIARAVEQPGEPRPPVLGERLSGALASIESMLANTSVKREQRSWVACKLLLWDREFTPMVEAQGEGGIEAVAQAAVLRKQIEEQTGEDISVFVAERYHGFAHGLVTETLRQRPRDDARVLSDAVDRVLVHRVLGLPFFLAVMYAIFWVTFTVGEYPMGWIERGFDLLSDLVSQNWPDSTAPALRSMVLDGVIAGVGGVVVFLPNIVLLFFGLALLEDTGYMARAAFLMDRLMHRFGLHGKSFLPMLTGFGCTVPGIMATRTLENERDRLVTMLVLPLMSCGARLPIWMLLVPAFFAPSMRAPMLGAIYLFGVILALSLALLLRKTVLSGEEAPFVMELPPYRVPTLRAMTIKMMERSWLYLRKAGTVILGVSILMWFVTSYPKADARDIDQQITAGQATSQEDNDSIDAVRNLKESFAGRLSIAIEPIFRPLGFDWKLVTGMIGSFAAKEVFVAQMGIIHSLGESGGRSESLREDLSRNYSPLAGVSLILFLLIATPCMATVAVTRRESGKWKWAALQFFGLTALAYLISLVVYQGGLLLGFG